MRVSAKITKCLRKKSKSKKKKEKRIGEMRMKNKMHVSGKKKKLY